MRQTGVVPRTVCIDSAGDPRLADYTRLTDVSLRTHLEAEHGLFIAEGSKVISRAVAAGYPVRSVLLGRGRLADLPALGLGSVDDVPVYVVPDEVAEGITGYRVHRGALASLGRKPLPAVPAVIGSARRIVVLEDLVDHGNVGAIFRCAAALGVDAVVLSPRCADPLYRRSVKVSMGAVFAIPYARMTDWYDGLSSLRKAGFRVLALTPDERATPISSALPDAAARGPGGAAARDRRRRPFLPVAARGRRGGPHPDEPRGARRRGGLAERGGGRRDRLPAAGRPRLTRARLLLSPRADAYHLLADRG